VESAHASCFSLLVRPAAGGPHEKKSEGSVRRAHLPRPKGPGLHRRRFHRRRPRPINRPDHVTRHPRRAPASPLSPRAQPRGLAVAVAVGSACRTEMGLALAGCHAFAGESMLSTAGAACPGLPAVTPSEVEGSRRCRRPSFSRLAPPPPNHYDVPMVMTAQAARWAPTPTPTQIAGCRWRLARRCLARYDAGCHAFARESMFSTVRPVGRVPTRSNRERLPTQQSATLSTQRKHGQRPQVSTVRLRLRPLPFAVRRIRAVLSVLSVPSAISALRSVAVPWQKGRVGAKHPPYECV